MMKGRKKKMSCITVINVFCGLIIIFIIYWLYRKGRSIELKNRKHKED